MADHYEPLNGGLVTNRDPAVLAPGQLYYIRNAVYKPDSQALHRARGRSAWGTVTGACDIVGLKDVKFDNGDHYLVAMASNAYLTGAVTAGGQFAVLSAITAGTQLERVQFRNRYYLLNGVAVNATGLPSNKVIYLSSTAASAPPTVRQHGMLPVKSTPGSASAAGTFSLPTTGYYEYWTTEVAEVQQDGVTAKFESAFVGEPKTINVNALTWYPIIQRPETVNLDYTTHWRVYRSPKKETEAQKKFPVGFLVQEMGTATAQIMDTSTVASASAFPSAVNTAGYYFGFTNPINMTADGGASASVSATNVPAQQAFYSFTPLAVSGSIAGIEVHVQGCITAGAGPATVTVSLGKRDTNGAFTGSTYWSDKGTVGDPSPGAIRVQPGRGIASKSGLITSTNTAAPDTLVLGSSSERWFTNPSDTDINNALLMAMLSVSVPSGAGMLFDYIKMTVYYGASNNNEVVQFPCVVYTFGDVSTQIAKNGTPPSSSTGDIYEDTLVANDVNNPGIICFSYPGDPEAFPGTYFIDFETEENDRVRLIKVVNNRLVVGLDRSIWRVNYLPSERDASFDLGKCKEPISRSYGCVKPMCACVYSPDGSSEWLAFVSHNGVHATDGFEFKTLTRSLDWRALMPAATATPVALIDDPEMHELLFYFNDTANGVETALCLHLSYAPEHVAEGQLKISGPVHMRNYFAATTAYAPPTCALSVPRANGDTTIFLGYGGASADAGAGKVYQETGYNIPAKDPAMAFKTRRMFLAGFGQEFRLGELYGYANSYTSGQTYQYTAKTVKTNDNAGEVSKAVGYAAVSGMYLHNAQMRQMCEGLSVDFAVVSGHTDLAHEFLIMRGEGFGEEDSGK